MNSSAPFVVGYDGSDMADVALRYGVQLARREQRPLRVLIARGDLHRLSRWADEWTRGLAEEWAAMARRTLASEHDTSAEFVVRDLLAAEALVAESSEAASLVVGAVGHGTVTGKLQGSVSQHVCRHARCPVLVVRPPSTSSSNTVVVGVDGSDESMQALEFALRHATVHEHRLEVVYCPEQWRPYLLVAPDPGLPALVEQLEEYDAKVLAGAEAAVAGHDAIEAVVRRGSRPPADELVEASSAAALVVVGSRGRGAFPGLALGSVSADVLRRARCSVAVVR